MKSSVPPELPTTALHSSHAVVNNFAPFTTHPVSTYKSGKAVQTNGATSHRLEDFTEDLAMWRVFYGVSGGEIPESASARAMV